MSGENEQELRLGQLRMLVIVMVILFTVLLGYTIFWSINYNRQYGFFEKTTAEVVSQEVVDGKKRDTIKYYIGDVEYRLVADYSENRQIGDKLTIFYDKGNPFGVVYKLDNKRIILPILTGVFGAGCVVLVVLYILLNTEYKNRKRLKKYLEYQKQMEKDNVSVDKAE